MIKDFYENIEERLGIGEQDIATYSPLILAYIGDAVYEVVIRTLNLSKGNTSANNMHRKSSKLVKAETQAQMIKGILEDLTEEEQRIYKRGRNGKSFTKAKNASLTDYRMATGFEALIGYLYLTHQENRMLDIIKHSLEIVEED